MNIAVGVIVFFVALTLYAVVNSIEIAIVGANRVRIRHLSESGSRSAAAVERLQGRSERFFSAVVLLSDLAVAMPLAPAQGRKDYTARVNKPVLSLQMAEIA